MDAERAGPSPIVIVAALLVLAAIAFMFVRSGGGGVDNELTRALDRTLEEGGSFTATVDISTASGRSSNRIYEGVIDPGTDIHELVGEQAVLGNVPASEDVNKLGDEMVGETMTTHYTAIIDSELANELARERAEEAGVDGSSVTPAPRGIEERPMEIDVWIDREGLIRRYVTDESYSDGTVSASTTLDFTG